MPVYWTSERINAPQNTRNKYQRLRVSIPKHQRTTTANFSRGLSVCNGVVRSAHSVRKCNQLTWRSRMSDDHLYDVPPKRAYLCAKNDTVWPAEDEFPRSINHGLRNSLWWTNFKTSLQTSPWSCTKSILYTDDENREGFCHGPSVLLDENEFMRPVTDIPTRKRTPRWDEPGSCRLSKIKRKKKNPARQWRTIHLLGDYWSDSDLPEWSTSEDEIDSSVQRGSTGFTWSNFKGIVSSGKNENLATISQVIEDEQTPDDFAWILKSVYPQVNELSYVLALCNGTMESSEEKRSLPVIPSCVNNEVQLINESLGGLENKDSMWQLQEDLLQILTDSIYTIADIDPWSLCLPGDVNPPMALTDRQPCPTIFSYENIRMSYEGFEETLGSGILKYCVSTISSMTSKICRLLNETLQLQPFGREKELIIDLDPRSNCLEVTGIVNSKIPDYIERSKLKPNIRVPYYPASNTVKMRMSESWRLPDYQPCTLNFNLRNKYLDATPSLLNRGSCLNVQTTKHIGTKMQSDWMNPFYTAEIKAPAWRMKECSVLTPFKQSVRDLQIPEFWASKSVCCNDTCQLTSNKALAERDIELWPNECLLVVANLISSYASALWLLTEMNTQSNIFKTNVRLQNLQLPCSFSPQYLASEEPSIITLQNAWSSSTLVPNRLLLEPTLPKCIQQGIQSARAITQNILIENWQCSREQPTNELAVVGFEPKLWCVSETNQMKSLPEVESLNFILSEEILSFDAESSDDTLSQVTDNDDPDLKEWTLLNDISFVELEDKIPDEHDWIVVDAAYELVQ